MTLAFSVKINNGNLKLDLNTLTLTMKLAYITKRDLKKITSSWSSLTFLALPHNSLMTDFKSELWRLLTITCWGWIWNKRDNVLPTNRVDKKGLKNPNSEVTSWSRRAGITIRPALSNVIKTLWRQELLCRHICLNCIMARIDRTYLIIIFP